MIYGPKRRQRRVDSIFANRLRIVIKFCAQFFTSRLGQVGSLRLDLRDICSD